MDILTFTVGDMRAGLPFHRLALSVPMSDVRLAIDDTGVGTLDTTVQVMDLRRKFGFAILPGKPDVRLVMIEIESRYIGLMIDASSPVSTIRDAEIDSSTGTDNTYVTGVIMDQGEPIFLFDWDALLTSETVLNVNDLFSIPMLKRKSSASSDFLEAVVREIGQSDKALSHQQIRQFAETSGVPLSVANRLVTFYIPHSDE